MSARKLRVLVVDDEKIIREFLKRLLTVFAIDVEEVDNGFKAIDLVKANPFDLYFIDVRMPGIDGLDTFRGIRKIDPSAIVIMITGYAVEDILNQAKKEGAYGIIRKPFEINQIKDVVDDICNENQKVPEYVLVVDDDETILTFFSNLLKSKNIKFNTAKSREEALEKVNKEKFDLVFLDLVLREANGIDVFKEIKPLLPKANIVFTTGYPQKAIEAEGKVEVAGCLFKPFEVDSILKYIDKGNNQK